MLKATFKVCFAIAVSLFTFCTGPVGPQGPAGIQGNDGSPGVTYIKQGILYASDTTSTGNWDISFYSIGDSSDRSAPK